MFRNWVVKVVAVLEIAVLFVLFGFMIGQDTADESTTRQPANETPVSADLEPAAAISSPERLAAPIYTRSPLAQFNHMIREIETRIQVLESQNHEKQSAVMATALAAFKAERRGVYRFESELPEVHVVGLHDASSGDAFGPAHVRITYTGSPVILVLTSGNPIEWNLVVADDVVLDQVIVSGSDEQVLKGLADDVPVWNKSGESSSGLRFHCYERMDERFGDMVQQLQELTSLGVVTFQGTYRYPGKPFVIGPDDQDWRIQHLIARMVPLHEETTRETRSRARNAAEEISFNAMHLWGTDRHGFGGNASWGKFTVNGPILRTMQPLRRAYKHLTVDPKNNILYAVDHDVIRIDPEGGRPVALPIPAGIPRLSWPSGLAFDKKRRRVLLCSFGGGGHLYAYDVNAEKWSVLSSMRGINPTAMAWSEKYDAIFVIARQHVESRKSNALCELNSDGATVASYTLGAELPLLERNPRCQLIAVDDRLVLLAPGAGESRGFGAPPTHSYVISLKSHEIEYTAKLIQQ